MNDTGDMRGRETQERWLKLRRLAHERLRQGRGIGTDAVTVARCVRRVFGEPRLLQWDTMGVKVEQKRLAGSGMLLPDRFPIEVWVNQSDNVRRQRFTVAHELCHFLIRGAEAFVRSLGIEEFCETFASELLVPQSQLNALRTASGDLPSAHEIVELANRFGVNFAPVIVQISRVRVSRPSFAILARPAKERQELVIDRSAGAGTIGGLVVGQRLASIGSWGTLFDVSDDVQLNGTADVESRFLIPSMTTLHDDESSLPMSPRSGFVSGKVVWTAFRLRNRRVIISAVFMHVAELKLSSPRRSSASKVPDEAQLP